MKSYIINLPFRRDRLERLNYNLIKNYIVFNAVHFNSLEQDEKYNYKQLICTQDNQIDSDGAMGCFISHYKVLREIVNQNEHDYAFVFEDDVIITNEELFKDIENNLPQSFDVLMLGGVYPNTIPTNHGFYIPNYNKNASCTEAYIVSKKGAKKILEYIDSKKYTSMNIDWYYHSLGKIEALEYFCHEPMLTHQNHSDSNIKM